MVPQDRQYRLVGLCGRSGSGKGYVSELFASFGIPAIDTDAVYRNMTSPSENRTPCMQALCERFGEQAALDDNSLNRPYMRSLVFNGDASAREDLNRITHHFILEKTLEEAAVLAREGASVILIDAPLLYESGFNEFCAAVICVTAPDDAVIRRIMRRDNISEEDARKRLMVQKSPDELRLLADYEICNDCEKEVLTERVRKVAQKLLRTEDNV